MYEAWSQRRNDTKNYQYWKAPIEMKPGEQNEKGIINQILKYLIPGKE